MGDRWKPLPPPPPSCPVSNQPCVRSACRFGCGYIGNWPPPAAAPPGGESRPADAQNLSAVAAPRPPEEETP